MPDYRSLSRLLNEAAGYADDLAAVAERGEPMTGYYVRHLESRLNSLTRRIAIHRGGEFVIPSDAPAGQVVRLSDFMNGATS